MVEATGGTLTGRNLYIPRMSYGGARAFASAFRYLGVNAQVVPEGDARTYELAGPYTSGDECLPARVTVGNFLKTLELPGFDPAKTAFFMPTAGGPCRFGQYSPFLGQVLEEKGLEEIIVVSPTSADGYQGLAPSAEVYAAAVFEQDPERGEIASTVSLLRALDWLISAEVDVVNISLAGPPNRLLETALNRAAGQNVLVMAAAGNGGPVAAPMYPAAYHSVVAVTAVDAGRQVFRLANRGAYLDLAAPGVGLLHARAGGGYAASSGTSFAVPFAATAAARLMRSQPDADPLETLFNSAEDLGPPGRDDIYGYGLLRFAGL